MPAEGRNQAAQRRRVRRLRRLVIAALPTTVWLLAIVVAFGLYRRLYVSSTVTGHAQDEPVTLAHLEPGVVRKVHVQLYEEVNHGQVVVVMDDRQERIQLAAIEKDLERLGAEVAAERARVLADNARATADVEDLARRFAVDREAAHIEYLAQLAADARDRALLRGTLVEYEIVRTLYNEGNAAFRELNLVETQVDSLKATVEKNAEVLEDKKKMFQESDQRWIRFVEHDAVAVAYEPVLTPLRLAIDVRERDLEEVVRHIDAHVLRSPIDGRVTTLLAHGGDHVQAGSPLAVISPTSTDRVVAYLPEQMILAAQVGAPVSVTPLASAAGQRREYAGTIVSVSATVNEAPPRYRALPAYPVWGRGLVVALNDGVRLVPGEAVTIAFLNQQ